MLSKYISFLLIILFSFSCLNDKDGKEKQQELELYLALVKESIEGHTYSLIHKQGLNSRYKNTLFLFEGLIDDLEINNLDSASIRFIEFYKSEKWKDDFKLSDMSLDSLQTKVSRLEKTSENSILKASYLLDAYTCLISNTVTVCGISNTEIKFVQGDTLVLKANTSYELPYVIVHDGIGIPNCQYIDKPVITVNTPSYSEEIIFTGVETRVQNLLTGHVVSIMKKIPIRLTK